MCDCCISGTIRGALFMIFPTIMTILGCIGITIFMIPYDFYKAYSVIFLSRKIGTNVKILLFLSLWIPVLLWIPLVTVFVCIGAPVGYFIYAFSETYASIYSTNPRCNCLCTTEVNKMAYNCVYDFWNFNYRVYGGFIDEFNNPNYTGYVYEIRILQIFFGLILGIFGMVVEGIAVTVMCVKAVPICIRGFSTFTKCLCEETCVLGVCFLPSIIVYVLIVVACIMAVPISIIVSLFHGLLSPISTLYKHDNICDGLTNGFKQIFVNIYEIDVETNKIAFDFDGPSVCCFCFDMRIQPVNQSNIPQNNQQLLLNQMHPSYENTLLEQNQQQYNQLSNQQQPQRIRMNEIQSNQKRVDVFAIWANFFQMCTVHG